VIAFIVAGIGCALAGLCYAEFASMIPIAGSAYTYSYATMGELIAWIIGWDLVLEYAVGAATVAIAWSEYFNRVLKYVGCEIPYQWRHSPLESMDGVSGIMNIPAVVILGSSRRCSSAAPRIRVVNNLIVITKVTIVIMVIVLGGRSSIRRITRRSSPAHLYTTPEGVTHNFGGCSASSARRRRVLRVHRLRRGLDRGAGDQEPKRDMPIGILGSLVVCTLLYVLFSYVLSGIATVEDFRTPDAKRRSPLRSRNT
jgi:APA family basic amino acid/polyamine antiporter